MSMLADPRRKQKISSDPRNLSWKNDKNKFGQKLMEKMGWMEGKGLGVNGAGNVDPIKVSLKADNRGVGCTRNYADNWIAHQDDFNSLLANLNAAGGDDTNGYGSDPQPKRVQKLEEAGRSSRGRVHYMKFAKGKDLSAKTNEDLACIFGKRKSKSAPVTPQTQSEANSEDDEEEKNETQAESGIMTFNSGTSIQDYFAKKMAALKSERAVGSPNKIDRDEEEAYEQRIGFGFGGASVATSMSHDMSHGAEPTNESTGSSEESQPRKKKKKKDKEIVEKENACDIDAANESKGSSEESPSKKKKKKKDKESIKEENELGGTKMEDEEVGSILNKSKKKSKKRKKDAEEGKENTSSEDNSSEEPPAKKKKKKKQKSMEADDEQPVVDECQDEEIANKEPKKKKKKKSKDRDPIEPQETEENPDELKEGKSKANKSSETPKTKKKVTSSDSSDDLGFKGSNFAELKGYGHEFHPTLTHMPISKARQDRLNQSKGKSKR